MGEAIAYIYALIDPRDNEIHYVGKTNNPAYRLKQHMADRNTNVVKVEWIYSLLADGLEPRMEILETTPSHNWAEIEQRWIAKGKAEGWPLTNVQVGGGGRRQELLLCDALDDYLPSEQAAIYKSLDETTQRELCRGVALRGFEFSWIHLKRSGKNPSIEFSVEERFRQSATFAGKLIALVGTPEFYKAIREVEKRLKRVY